MKISLLAPRLIRLVVGPIMSNESSFDSVLPQIYKGYEYNHPLQPSSMDSALSESKKVITIEELAGLRIQHGWTLEALADRLKLSNKQIHALESGQWHALPKGGLLKAFVRSYCRALNCDPAPILAILPPEYVQGNFQLQPDKGIDAPFRSTQNLPRPYKKRNWFGWFVLLIVLLGGLTVYAWQQHISTFDSDNVPNQNEAHSTSMLDSVQLAQESSTSAQSPQETAAVEATKNNSMVQTIELGSVGVAASANNANSSAPLVSAGTTSDLSAVANTSTATIQKQNEKSIEKMIELTFIQDSWVEIRQADGSLILSGIRKAGDNVALEGKAPLVVVIGNAAGVKLSYKGKPVAVEGEAKSNVARLTLN